MRRSALLVVPVLAAVAAGGWWFAGRDRTPASVAPIDDALASAEDVAATDGAELKGGARPAALRADPSSLAASPYKVLATVVDEKGQPLADVTVRVRSSGRIRDPFDTSSWGDPKDDDPARKAIAELDDPRLAEGSADPTGVTDKEGKAEISVPSMGYYEVRALPVPGRVGASGWANVTRDKPLGRATLKLLAGTPLSGRVVDASDKGVVAIVAGAWIAQASDGTPNGVNVPQAATDGTGAFTLGAVPDGKGTLVVRVAGLGTFTGFKVTTPTKDEVVLRIGGGGVVRGRILDTSGQAVAAADIAISTAATKPVADGAARGSQLRGRSGADGTYRIEGVVPGAVKSVSVVAAGYVSLTQYAPAAKWSGTEVKEGVEATIDLVLFRGGAVKGRVIDRSDKDGTSAVTNAEVFLLGGGGGLAGGQSSPRVATVDKDGVFRFDAVPLGKYVLYARSPTHYAATGLDGGPSLPGGRPIRSGGETNGPATTVLVLTKDGETFEKNVFMLRGFPVAGVVKGPEGTPVEGAKITSSGNDPVMNMAWQYGLQPQGALVLATSGPDGRFQVPGLPPGDQVTLQAGKKPFSGKPCKPFKVSADAPTPDVTLELEKGASISGKVVDADGKGVAGVSVQCWNQNGNGNADEVTGADGAFRLEGLGAGSYQLWCWQASGGNAQKMLDPELKAGEDREGVELKLTVVAKTSAKLSGTLVDEEGNPVGERNLMAQGSNGANAWAQTDADGSFTFPNLPPGKVTLSVQVQTVEGYSTNEPLANATYDVPGEGIKVVVPKRVTTVVAGRVLLPDGTPCPLCYVATKASGAAKASGGGRQVMSPDGNSFYDGRNNSGEVVNGEFRREVALKPPFDVVVTGPRDAEGRPLNLRSKTVSVTESSTSLEIRLEGGQELRGKVLAADGSPVTGAYVAVVGGPGSDRTADDGSFRLVGLEGDEVSISVQPTGKFVAPAQPTKAKPGATDVVIRLEAGLSITGRVVDAAGGVVTSAFVQVMGTAGSNRSHQSTQVDSSGVFRIENLPRDGVFDVTVQVWNQSGKGANYKPWAKSGVRPGAEELLVRLEGGETLEGVVVDGEGKPVPNAWVNAVSVGGGKGSGGANSDEQGRFTIGGLEPGAQIVRAQQWNGTQRQSLPVRADAGARDVRVVFPSTVKLSGRVVGDGERTNLGVAVRLPGPISPDGTGQIAYGRTMADGTFTVDVPVDTLLDVAVTGRGDDRWGLASGVRGGGAEVTVRLEVGKSIEGVVEDADGNPVTQNAWLSATSDGWIGSGSVDATGKFKVRALAPGRYKLRVQNGMGTRNPTVVEADAGATGVRIRLSN